MTKCNHCGMDIEIRNPSGYCDHLHYPESCKICKKMNKCDDCGCIIEKGRAYCDACRAKYRR